MVRFLLPVLSFGKMKIDDLLSSQAGFNWFGFRNEQDGKLLVSAPMAGWLGLFVWSMLLIAILAFR